MWAAIGQAARRLRSAASCLRLDLLTRRVDHDVRRQRLDGPSHGPRGHYSWRIRSTTSPGCGNGEAIST
jgi:hypothetical protein